MPTPMILEFIVPGNMPHQREKDLHHRLARCQQVASTGGCVATGLNFGVLVSLGTHPIGLWSAQGDEFVFRELANYEPKFSAATLDDAHRRTISMLQSCRNGWAERLGPLAMMPTAA